jgi:alginate O-acetyltransferase complex protein AlgI
MTLTSWPFVAFVAVTFALYYLPVLRQWQVQFLVLASLCFYGALQPQLLGLPVAAVLGTYCFLRVAIERRTLGLAAGIAFNLGLLALFKYRFLFIDPATPPSQALSYQDPGAIDWLLRLPLPIGISFFVLHNISLLIDLGKPGRAAPAAREVLLYILFFPQLVAGPITRTASFLPQIKPKLLADVALVEATKWLVAGYFFKLFVANNLDQITSNMQYPLYEALTVKNRWLCVFLYSYQIYADFFGYSAIAIGLALLFGYRLPKNFNLPYISTSFAQFWRRWHISFSTWLRTYLYIPLGGNREGSARTYFNLMIVMGLGGFWNGAALGYLAWGLLHGLFLVAERPLLPRIDAIATGRHSRFLVQSLRVGLVFLLVSMAWILFKLPNFQHAADYVHGMFVEADIRHPYHLYNSLALLYSLPVLLQHAVPRHFLQRQCARLEPYLYGLMATLMLVEAGPASPFIYFQF